MGTNPVSVSNSLVNLTAQDAYLNQPDGQTIYSWGYGCVANSIPSFLPANVSWAQTPSCSTMQVPGPTMIVSEGTSVTITLTNNLPVAVGNTSILFPGFQVSVACPRRCDAAADLHQSRGGSGSGPADDRGSSGLRDYVYLYRIFPGDAP